VGPALTIERGYGQLRPDTDPASIEPAVLAARRRVRLQFDEPLSDDVLRAAAESLDRRPDVMLRAYGRRVDPGLGWLSGFEHIEHLSIELWEATSFERLGGFTNLRSLGLGQTRSARPSLAFLRTLQQLEDLWVEGHEKGSATIGALSSLRRLALRVPRMRSLDYLRGHPRLEIFEMTFGGIRDLSPLAEMPALRALELYQVRKLDSEDLDAVGACRSLIVLSLGALRNVHSLRALAQGPADTLRLLTLERLTGLATLAELAACRRLEQLGLYDARPGDRRLDVLPLCPRLNRLVVADPYPADQVAALRAGFEGDTLVLHGDGTVRGDIADVLVRWRAPVRRQLDALDEGADPPGGGR
jgi:hypothetical protein